MNFPEGFDYEDDYDGEYDENDYEDDYDAEDDLDFAILPEMDIPEEYDDEIDYDDDVDYGDGDYDGEDDNDGEDDLDFPTDDEDNLNDSIEWFLVQDHEVDLCQFRPETKEDEDSTVLDVLKLAEMTIRLLDALKARLTDFQHFPHEDLDSKDLAR